MPKPTSAEKPGGEFCAHRGIPESCLTLEWGETPAVPEPVALLTVTCRGRSWKLRQDMEDPERWSLQRDPDGEW